MIIYNESNIQDFTILDPQKIYLVFSKLNEAHYLLEIQHASTLQNLAKIDSYFESVSDYTSGDAKQQMFTFEEQKDAP